jgi:anti-anti-sigma factor
MSRGGLAVQIDGPVIYAKYRGEIDLSNVDELREELIGVTPNDALGILFDLSEVDYLDSAGLRLLQRLREDLRVRDQRLRLVIPEGSVILSVLRLAGLDWREDIVETAEAGRHMLEPDQGCR